MQHSKKSHGVIILWLAAIFLFPRPSWGQTIIPKPHLLEQSGQAFPFSSINIVYAPTLKVEAGYLKTELEKRQMKVYLNSQATNVQPIYLKVKRNGRFMLESYTLHSTHEISIEAPTRKGLFYGIQSLLQLIGTQKKEFKLLQTHIEDEPRFAWRGMHLDVSRHFFSVDFVKKYIDILALHKMNTFHWHLTDDQGWRIEIKKYPLLTQEGSKRKETIVEKNFNPFVGDGTSYEGFYTQDQIREVVAYAQARHITVVPEIEMPGHSVAAIAAYPFLSCTQQAADVLTSWGVSEDVLCVKDSTFSFVFDVLEEVMTLFPSKYIHIGGDEVPKSRWQKCAQCQGVIKAHGLKDEHELQSYFITKIDSFVTAQGRSVIGWDEILEGGLAPNAAVMSWRGEEGGMEAAKLQHKVVMCPGSHCYFDHYQGNKKTEPLAIGGYTTVRKTYGYEPIPAALDTSRYKYIMGAQGNVWTEYIATPEHVMYMALPRLCALSEVLWSKKEDRNYDDFSNRLISHFKLLESLHINYARSIFDVHASAAPATKGLEIKLASDLATYSMRYTLNGNEPNAQSTLYLAPFTISKNTTLKAALFSKQERLGNVFTQDYEVNIATGTKITLIKEPHKSYNKGGANTLLDGVVGSLPWSGNEWLGWRGEDMEALVDIGKVESIQKIKISFLKAPESWIQLPSQVYLYSSIDGIKFELLKAFNELELEEINQQGGTFYTEKIKAQYLKIRAISQHEIPEGQPGAGQAAWLFCSEIMVE